MIITEEQARASENYISALGRMKGAVGGLKNQFIGGAIGPITKAFDILKDSMKDQGPFIAELGQKFGEFLAKAVEKLPEIIQKIKEFGTWIKDSVTSVANFVGGWQNLGKIIAMLAIAPTFISGIKVVISLFSMLKAVVGLSSAIMGIFGTSAGTAGAAAAAGGAAGATGFGAMAAAVWAATWPVLAVIAAIALVAGGAYLIIKNWDKIKEFFGKLWSGIKEIFTKAWEGIKELFFKYHPVGLIIKNWEKITGFFSNLWGGIKNVFSKTWEGIKTGVSKLGGVLKNNWKSIAIGMVNPMAGGLKALYDNNETFRNLVDGTWAKIKDIFGKVWDSMPDGVKNVFLKIKDIIGGAVNTIKGIIDGIRNFFVGLWGALKEGPTATIEYLKNAFFGLFDKIKEKIESFVNFFKEKMEAVKNFFGGIGDKISGFTSGAVDKFKSFLPGHAEGGVFTKPHIAQIAEAGAEAVVPLNKSPQGFDIWKQAGQLGGYADMMRQKTQTGSTSAASPPPVMQAAAQRISGGENIANVNFSQNITINGTPDKETVNQLSAAGVNIADDFEARFKDLFENMMRNQRRVSFA
jgi:phage-related protein